jgi:hypothetical protein
MDRYETMKRSQLVDAYNVMADKAAVARIADFRSRAQGMKRCRDLENYVTKLEQRIANQVPQDLDALELDARKIAVVQAMMDLCLEIEVDFIVPGVSTGDQLDHDMTLSVSPAAGGMLQRNSFTFRSADKASYFEALEKAVQDVMANMSSKTE